MSAIIASCPGFTADGGIADALRAVDCQSAAATAQAFGRLLGDYGMLGPVLTLVLTLYVGLLAVNLLTGRGSLGLSMLTPRMLGLGLVLTFATSWIAYQSVVWNLLVAGPDWIASLLIGSRGSATALFADRLDGLFDAVARAAENAQNAPAGSAGAAGAASPTASAFTPATVLWLAAMLLLLGTVGVLLVARIALAAMLALGPVLILMGLFDGTRGLFEGWLKTAVLFALVPLLTVLIGGAGMVMLAPLIASLDGGQPDMREAATVFLGACVQVALMVMTLKTATTLTAGWRLPGGRSDRRDARPSATPLQTSTATCITANPAATVITPPVNDRVRAIVSGLAAHEAALAPSLAISGTSPAGHDRGRAVVALPLRADPAPGHDVRARGIGNRFRAVPAPSSSIKASA